MSDSSLLPPILSPSSLYSQEARRDATRIRIYNNVLMHINNKIKAVARVPGNEKSLWYVVPEFIPGTPRFDMGDCILYLAWNLRNVGYIVDYTHPNLLFISWRNHNIKYQERESPWAQVLNSARQHVLTTAHTTTPPVVVSTGIRTAPTIHAPQAPTTQSLSDVQKRKTVLKKTNEYRPYAATSGLSLGLDSDRTAASGITGALSPKHVSFV